MEALYPGRSDRVRQIADVLARHGLGYPVGVLGLGRFVPFHRGCSTTPAELNRIPGLNTSGWLSRSWTPPG
jgi:hypothetical protein